MRDWIVSIEFLCVVDCRLSSIFENWDDLNNAAKVLIYQTKGWEKNHLLIRIILIRSLLSFCFSLLFTVFVFIIIIIILQLQQKGNEEKLCKMKSKSGKKEKLHTHKKNTKRCPESRFSCLLCWCTTWTTFFFFHFILSFFIQQQNNEWKMMQKCIK